MGTKRPQPIQHYEKYWSLTLETSDIYGKQFNGFLNTIVNKIDDLTNKNAIMNSQHYKDLQDELAKQFKKADYASIRKGINQFLKLGFINNGLKSYHFLTKQFLSEKDDNNRKLLLSKIMYDNASFDRSYSKDANVNEINFLIKTLEYCKRIDKDQMMGLISTNIANYPKGYLTEEELDELTNAAFEEGFGDRKYNQRNYIFGLCKYLTGVFWSKTAISINNDLDELHELSHGRDPYSQRLYKEELKTEVREKYGEVICCLTKAPFIILIASHIKPYHLCDPNEQFDKNNGLLLSRDFDGYFDSGKVSFDNEGKILFGPAVDSRIKNMYKNYKLDSKIFNDERKRYMSYHRHLYNFPD